MTTVTSPAPAASPDLAAIKARQQVMWASGDFAVIGTTLQIVGEQLCEAVDLRAGERVLDVAAGNGNATLAAARRFADVTSTDYVPALLEGGRRRAEAEGLVVRFEGADAEDLPYTDGSFDVVLSTFGVMFAPDHRKSANELLRVCRRGGRIGLANWTPEGFIGKLFRVVGRYVPPPPTSSRRRSGARPPTCAACSATRTSSTSRATLPSATAPRSTSWTYSAPSMVRCTRRLPGSTTRARRGWNRTCSRCCAIRIAAGLPGWSCRPSTWRS